MTVDALVLACGKLQKAFPDGVVKCIAPSYDGILFILEGVSKPVKYFYEDGRSENLAQRMAHWSLVGEIL